MQQTSHEMLDKRSIPFEVDFINRLWNFFSFFSLFSLQFAMASSIGMSTFKSAPSPSSALMFFKTWLSRCSSRRPSSEFRSKSSVSKLMHKLENWLAIFVTENYLIAWFLLDILNSVKKIRSQNTNQGACLKLRELTNQSEDRMKRTFTGPKRSDARHQRVFCCRKERITSTGPRHDFESGVGGAKAFKGVSRHYTTGIFGRYGLPSGSRYRRSRTLTLGGCKLSARINKKKRKAVCC